MKKKFWQRMVSCTLTATMVAGLAACGGTTEGGTPTPTKAPDAGNQGSAGNQEPGGQTQEPVATPTPDPYKIITDANGNKIDLGGKIGRASCRERV